MILTVTLNAAVDKTHIIRDFQLHGVNRPSQVLAMAGGKGINVARVLNALGQSALAMGIVAGHRGAFILDSLAEEGIAHDFTRLATGESRTCLAIVQPETGQQTEILEPGVPVGPEGFADFCVRFQARLPEADWVILSGSLPPDLDARAYLHLMALARAAGKPVSLDASDGSLPGALAGRPDIVHTNQGEAEMVLGRAVTPDNLPQAVLELLDAGPGLAALTMGELGAAVARRTPAGTLEAYFVGAPPITVVSPIGSGDSFLAGLVTGLVRGLTLGEAARLGVAAGSANAAVPGAAACTRAQIEALLPMTPVEPLDLAFPRTLGARP